MNKPRFKLLLIIILGLIVLTVSGIYFHHLRITKPFRTAQTFLNLLNKGNYTKAIEMCSNRNSYPILDRDRNVIGIHFDNNIGSIVNDWYFDDLRHLEILYPSGLYWYIKRNFIGDHHAKRGIVNLSKGCYFKIKGETIEYIVQKI